MTIEEKYFLDSPYWIAYTESATLELFFCTNEQDMKRMTFWPQTDAYELLRCEAAPAILQTFEIRWFTT